MPTAQPPSARDVAFLGLGKMGRLMATHVVGPGHRVSVWNRSPGRAGDLVASGAREASSIADAVAGADAVVLMLFDGAAVREVLRAVLAAARPGTLVIDSSTIGPSAAREFGKTCAAAGLHYVDAPVAGSTKPAAEGTLTVLAGGADDDFAEAREYLHLWGADDRVFHLGPVGTGNAMKLVINLALGVAITGLGEALRLAEDLKLDESSTFAVLGGSPLARSLELKKDKIARRDASTPEFAVGALAKDLTLALGAAKRSLPLTKGSRDVAQSVIEAGGADEDMAALAIALLRAG